MRQVVIHGVGAAVHGREARTCHHIFSCGPPCLCCFQDVRLQFLEQNFIRDNKCTGTGTIRVEAPCHQCHYGLCVTRDADFFADGLACGKSIMAKFLGKGPCCTLKAGAAILCEGSWEDAETRCLFLYFSSKRDGRDKFVVFTESECCEQEDTTTCLQPTLAGKQLQHHTSFQIARKYFAVEHPGGPLKSVAMYTLDAVPVCREGLPVASCIWRGKRKLAKYDIWPEVDREGIGANVGSTPCSDLAKTMLAGFQELHAAREAKAAAPVPKVVTQAKRVQEFNDSESNSDPGTDAEEFLIRKKQPKVKTRMTRMKMRAISRRISQGNKKQRKATGASPNPDPPIQGPLAASEAEPSDADPPQPEKSASSSSSSSSSSSNSRCGSVAAPSTPGTAAASSRAPAAAPARPPRARVAAPTAVAAPKAVAGLRGPMQSVPVRGRAKGRNSRKQPWGLWSIAEVVSSTGTVLGCAGFLIA